MPEAASVEVAEATVEALVESRATTHRRIDSEGDLVLPGGGVALLRAASTVKAGDDLSDDQLVGYNIVVRACRAPLTMISENAGQDGGIVCEKVCEKKGNDGYNALTDTYEDLVKAGVIDPTKVTRTALGNSASVATLLLTSDALVAEKPKDDKGKKGSGGDYDMY